MDDSDLKTSFVLNLSSKKFIAICIYQSDFQNQGIASQCHKGSPQKEYFFNATCITGLKEKSVSKFPEIFPENVTDAGKFMILYIEGHSTLYMLL